MSPADEPVPHRLFLLRHAQAGDTSGGLRDVDRRLTRHGRSQARDIGRLLADQRIDLILASPAMRARQTADLLGLTAPIDYRESLYNAGSQWIAGELAGVADWVPSVLVVAHAPGIPALAHDLASTGSDPSALAIIDRYFPPATLVGLEFEGSWAELVEARVVLARRG